MPLDPAAMSALDGLSPQDRVLAGWDLLVYGNMYIRVAQNPDGTATSHRVDPMDVNIQEEGKVYTTS